VVEASRLDVPACGEIRGPVAVAPKMTSAVPSFSGNPIGFQFKVLSQLLLPPPPNQVHVVAKAGAAASSAAMPMRRSLFMAIPPEKTHLWRLAHSVVQATKSQRNSGVDGSFSEATESPDLMDSAGPALAPQHRRKSTGGEERAAPGSGTDAKAAAKSPLKSAEAPGTGAWEDLIVMLGHGDQIGEATVPS